MKKVNLKEVFTLFLMSVSIALITSCNKENEEEISIEGDWYLSQLNSSSTIDGSSAADWIAIENSITPEVAGSIINDSLPLPTDGGIIEFLGNNIYENEFWVDYLNTTGSWRLLDDKIMMDYENKDGESNTVVFEIKKLKVTELDVEIKTSYYFDFNNDGVDEEVECIVSLDFFKI